MAKKHLYEYYDDPQTEQEATPQPEINVGKSHYIQGKPKDEPIAPAVEATQAPVITTPQGREVPVSGNVLHSLYPESYWKDLEQAEIERKAKQEARNSQLLKGKMLGDAIRVLGDVAGYKAGAHNARWEGAKYEPIYKAQEALDADSAAKLQRLKEMRETVKYGQAKDADAIAARDKARADLLEQREEDRTVSAQIAADKLAYQKEQDAIKAGQFEDELKLRKSIAYQNAQKKTTEPAKDKKNVIIYSTKESDRANPYYKNIGANESGDVEIEPQHAHAMIRGLLSQYEAVQKDNTPGYLTRRTAFKKQPYFAALERYIANGGNLDKMASGDMQVLLDAAYTPEQHLRVTNQLQDAPAEGNVTASQAQQQWQNPFSAVSEYYDATGKRIESAYKKGQDEKNRSLEASRKAQEEAYAEQAKGEIPTITIPEEEVEPSQPVNEAAKKGAPAEVAKNFEAIKPKQAEAPRPFNNPALMEEVNSPEWTRQFRKLTQTPYEQLGSIEDMQDKFVLTAGDKIKRYRSGYPIANTSPMANSHREKYAKEIADDLLDYLSVYAPDQIEALQILSAKEKQPIESYLMQIAHQIGSGDIDITTLKQ